jgi:hypothetical protein
VCAGAAVRRRIAGSLWDFRNKEQHSSRVFFRDLEKNMPRLLTGGRLACKPQQRTSALLLRSLMNFFADFGPKSGIFCRAAIVASVRFVVEGALAQLVSHKTLNR